jgi:hypothetical protein
MERVKYTRPKGKPTVISWHFQNRRLTSTRHDEWTRQPLPRRAWRLGGQLLWTRILVSRMYECMPGQTATNYREHPGKLGAAYDQGPTNEDWAQVQILAQYRPHLGHLLYSINTIIMHHARYVRYITTNINPNTLTDLGVGVLAGAHHCRRSSGLRNNPTVLCWSRRPPCSSYIPVRSDYNRYRL